MRTRGRLAACPSKQQALIQGRREAHGFVIINFSCSHVDFTTRPCATWHCPEGFSTILFGESETYIGEQQRIDFWLLLENAPSFLLPQLLHQHFTEETREDSVANFITLQDVFSRSIWAPEPRTVIKEPSKLQAEICPILFKGTIISY